MLSDSSNNRATSVRASDRLAAPKTRRASSDDSAWVSGSGARRIRARRTGLASMEARLGSVLSRRVPAEHNHALQDRKVALTGRARAHRSSKSEVGWPPRARHSPCGDGGDAPRESRSQSETHCITRKVPKTTRSTLPEPQPMRNPFRLGRSQYGWMDNIDRSGFAFE